MLLIALFALASPAEAKTSAMDDWHKMTIVSVGNPSSTSGATYLVVKVGDIDGDGVSDDAYLKLACSDGRLTDAWYQVKSPRDSASGMASGKRQHGQVTFVKEWGPSSPQLMAMKPTYDIKTMKGGRAATGEDDWTAITLGNTNGLCTAATAAAQAIVKSKSNITNN